MADDFKIKIGLDGTNLGSGVGTSGQAGVQAQNNTAFGVSKGMKLAGIVGILSSMKVVTDTIAIAIQTVSVVLVGIIGILGNLLGQFLLYITPFFKDPVKYLLKFGVFIVNGIITGLEFVTNTLIGALNKVIDGLNNLNPFSDNAISNVGTVELPRLQEGLVMKAYDDYKTTIVNLSEDGKLTLSESFGAGLEFLEGLKNSFMTNTEFQKLIQEEKQKEKEEFNKALEDTKNFTDVIKLGSQNSQNNFVTAFNSLDGLADAINKKANEIKRSFGGSSRLTGVTTFNDANSSPSNAIRERIDNARDYLFNRSGG